jgi:ParB family chromosome partitioning protein
MQMIDIEKLTPHQRNSEFFDDIEGSKWNDFKKSIERRGVIEPVVVTQDLIIVSGHQRIRAVIEIGNEKLVPCRVTHYPNVDDNGYSKEDQIVEDLICTNVMQRGVGNVNPMKLAKCIVELERIYGIRHGSNIFQGNRHTGILVSPQNSESLENKTQEELAKLLGISVDQLGSYKKLINLIPPIQEMVSDDELKKTIAVNIAKQLTSGKQEEFFLEVGKETLSKLTKKELDEKLIDFKLRHEEEKYVLKQKIEKLQKHEFESVEKLKKDIENKSKQYNLLKEREEILNEKIEIYEKDTDKYNQLKSQIDSLTKQKDDIGRQIESGISLSGYIYEIEDFLKNKLAPIKYSRALMEMKDNKTVIKNITDIVNAVDTWSDEIKKMIPNENKRIIIESEDK